MDLKEIRKKLDSLDQQLVEIISERISLIPEIANYKKERKLPRRDEKREQEIKEKLKDLAQKNKVDFTLIEKIISLLIEESHKIEKEILKY